MLTFRDFLLERAQSPDQVAQTLLNQCMPYINAIGEVEFDTVLYRGTDSKIDDFVKRERRDAGGLTAGYSGERGDLLRTFFNRKFEINLDVIIFTTGDLPLAQTFGNPYVVFPTGEFKFVYSTTGMHMINLTGEKELENAKYVGGVADDNSEDGLPNPDLRKAVKSGTEVLIQANGYFPISLSYWKTNGQAILEELSFR